jgi:DNA polymerase-1
VPDLKALVGDPSDDIPGVRGIGPKTAAALLRVYPTVERLLDNLDRLTVPGTRARLAPMRERILLNKQLVLLRPVPMRSSPDDLRITASREEELRALARETGMAEASA